MAYRHPDFEVVAAADPNPAAVERIRAQHPDVVLGQDPSSLAEDDRLDALYIASPPDTHASYAMAAGKAVFSEKPLTVRLTDGTEMVRVAAETGAVNALNFTLSDRAAAVAVGRAVNDGEAGDILGVDMRFTFPSWPRAFQRDARWVASAFGTFTAGGTPITITGRVAATPETYEWILYGTKRSYRITGWSHLHISDGGPWAEVPLSGPRGSEHTRLSAFADAIRGHRSTLADFAAGLRVQQAVEHFHRTAS